MKLSSLLIPVLSVALAASSFAGTAAKSGKAATCCTTAADDSLFGNVGATVTVGYDTDYVFRGIQFAKNLVSAGIDLPITLNDQLTLALGAWYGASAGDGAAAFAGGGSYGELDLTAALLVKLGPVTAGLKYTWYDYLGNAGKSVKDINELGITLGTSIASIDLAAGAYYDWTTEGFYYEVGASHTIKVNSWLSLVPGALISWGTDYYGVDGGNHIKLSLAAPIKLSKCATLTPYIAGNLPYDSLHDLGEKNRVYGGVALSVTF